MKSDMTDPRVSVCVMTYNHARFIGDCLRSLIAQETNFRFEIIIGDDCSTDGAGDIISEFALEFPHIVRVLRPERNQGPTRNYLSTHNAALGEYVAHIDGDDLALPGKLARQTAFLDRHSDVVLCGHNVGIISEEGSETGQSFPKGLRTKFGVGKVIRSGMPFFNSSMMYRREFRTLFFSSEDIFDWYFLTDILRFGQAGYIPEKLGLYRINATSLTSTLRRAKMRGMMLANYARRLPDLPGYRSDFFAYAFLNLLSCVWDREGVTGVHRQLLRDSVSLGGLFKAVDTVLWRWRNAGGLAR